MAITKIVDDMRTTVALDATKLAGAVPSGSLGNAVAADNSITLEKMASGTDGQVITYSAAGDPVAIGPGTAGQVLTSAGANLPQTFADAGGGSRTLLETQTLSSSTTYVDFTSYINSTYMIYEIMVVRAKLSASASVLLQVSTNAGTSWLADQTMAYYINKSAFAGSAQDRINNDALIILNGAKAGTGDHFNGLLRIYSPSTADLTGFTYHFMNTDVGNNEGYGQQANGAGVHRGTTAINGIRFKKDGAGTFDQGTFKLYGVS